MKRYAALDTLRGVAALAVVLFHLGQVRLEPDLASHGYLAVDFFFVLSGFVVAHAYETALCDRLTWTAFAVKRFIRLYPLALLGALAGAAILLLKWRLFPEKVDPLPTILASSVLNSLMLPNVFGGVASRNELFPGDGPLWSLFLEMLINLLWAAFGVRLRTTYLALFALANAAVLIVLTAHHGNLNIGFDKATFAGGVVRVCFSFPVGVMIYRLHVTRRLPEISFGAVLLSVVLFFVFTQSVLLFRAPIWDLLSVLVTFPLVVVAGIHINGNSRLGSFLGELSYPLYVLHFPVLLIFSGLQQSILSAVNVHLLSTGAFITAISLSWATFCYYDKPLRRYLSDLVSQTFSQRAPTLNV